MFKAISGERIPKSITPILVHKPDAQSKSAQPFEKATPQAPKVALQAIQPDTFPPIPPVPALELQKFLTNAAPSATQTPAGTITPIITTHPKPPPSAKASAVHKPPNNNAPHFWGPTESDLIPSLDTEKVTKLDSAVDYSDSLFLG